MPLLKHIPYMVGEYNVVHSFNLVEALPETFQTVINLIGTVVGDPGAFIIGCGEEDPNTGELMATDDCPIPTAGLAGLLIGFLPDSGTLGELRSALESFTESDFGRAVARNAINDAVQDFLQNNDSVPDWVGSGITITDDIIRSLRNFRVNATLHITEQPTYLVGEDGRPVADDQGRLIAQWKEPNNRHLWNDIIFHWRYGCDEMAPPGLRRGRRDRPEQRLLG